ncbi:MAG: hypothetical protein JSS86_12965 [Cyanobacteria bacterium SZAS LIN-2]|nr:hypothetical protein [Cyanobacteria bacterium SZAS LIN-3]MBS1997221.1 hypothetical protein [Cyanobacteria bacterium SZAS LIN-2]
MNKSGLSRPGAMLMLMSAALMVISGVGPVFLAVSRPTHDWLMVLTGMPAFGIIAASALVAILYFVGFLRYCGSKGYSAFLGFWLFLGNVPGFIVLLLLPDLKVSSAEHIKSVAKAGELSTAG